MSVKPSKNVGKVDRVCLDRKMRKIQMAKIQNKFILIIEFTIN